MHSDTDDPCGPGFPIRTSQDQSSVTSSPGLIAGSNVLHRLSTPRHPPCALSSLTVPTSTRSQGRERSRNRHSIPELSPRKDDKRVSVKEQSPARQKGKRVIRKHLATQDLSASASSDTTRGLNSGRLPVLWGTGSERRDIVHEF